MRYMLLIYRPEEELARLTEHEKHQTINAVHDLLDESRAQGILEGAEPLARTSTATTVRVQSGKAVITDGPFAETREQLAGYYIVNCRNREDAIAYATRIPVCGGKGGCVEVRELPGLPARVEETEAQAVSASVNG
jgi:hypothetical protein